MSENNTNKAPDEPKKSAPTPPQGGSGASSTPPKRPSVARTWISILLLVGLAAVWWWNSMGSVADRIVDINYSPEFSLLIDEGLVKSVSIELQDGLHCAKGAIDRKALGSIVANHPELESVYSSGAGSFRVNLPDPTRIGEELRARGIEVGFSKQDNRLSALLMNLAPTLLLIAVIYFVFVRQMRSQNSAMGFGKSRARRSDQNSNKVLFKDVAGCDEAKEDVQEVVEFLKNPGKFNRLGGKMPHGILMSGPPGTGKTLIAKAIAGEADVPFFSIAGSDFVEMFVGVGASRVRDMFAEAKKNAPCLVFIDEIDAVGRRRGTGIGGGHDEREQTLNSLLVEMDGFESNTGIVVIAATNRPDVLDPALLRPGRFDRQLVVNLPTMEGRLEILKVHAAKITLAPGTDLERIARGTPGCSGADLANIVNESALIAARQDKPGVDEDDLEEARDKILWGRERRSHVMDDDEKRRTAYHEAGHAILAVLEPEFDPLHKITIIPRGMALGLTAFLPKKDRVSVTRGHLLADLVVTMGGRVAEELFMSDVSTGARQDLKQATDVARAMVCDWGLSERLGPRTFGRNEELMFLGREVNRTQDYSEETARIIDEEVSKLIRNAYDKAHKHISEHRDAMEALVTLLLEKETVDGSVAEDIIRYGHVRTPEEKGEVPPLPPPPPPVDASAAAKDSDSTPEQAVKNQEEISTELGVKPES